MTTRNLFGESHPVGPVLKFALLLIPMVMNGFYMVYSLTGWILTGKDKLNWSIEAVSVGMWVCAGMLIFCALVTLYSRWKGAGVWHPLIVSSVGHAAVVVLLTLSIFISVKL